MTISERIFDLLAERKMTQREFSEKTGIAQSTISDWKRKKTNPVSEKILIICQVLGVTPNELLSGTEGEGTRSNRVDYMILSKDSEMGQFVVEFQAMNSSARERLLGYMKALQDLR
jgi:transcriptional regulator with XRE-family HTH domain